jgi:hypothetical protein
VAAQQWLQVGMRDAVEEAFHVGVEQPDHATPGKLVALLAAHLPMRCFTARTGVPGNGAGMPGAAPSSLLGKEEAAASSSPLPQGGQFPLFTRMPVSGSGRLHREYP